MAKNGALLISRLSTERDFFISSSNYTGTSLVKQFGQFSEHLESLGDIETKISR